VNDPAPLIVVLVSMGQLLAIVLIRYCQFLTTLGTTASQYSATVSGSHSFTESVFVFSLSVRGLECSFHFYILFYVIIIHLNGLQN
jgi:hypothetical protein